MTIPEMNTQEQSELEVFRSFVSVCPLHIVPDSIRKQAPPAPDIGCQLADGSRIVFELVEVLDSDLARKDQDVLSLAPEYETNCENIQRNDGAPLREELSDALVCVAYSETATLHKKRGVIPKVLDVLATLPHGHVGGVTVPASISHLVLRMAIRRGEFFGPCFSVESAGSFGNPVVSALRTKMAKPYRSEDAIELLAFYRHQPMLPAVTWVSAVHGEVEAELPDSSFRRVWVYDVASKKVAYVYPTPMLGADV